MSAIGAKEDIEMTHQNKTIEERIFHGHDQGASL